MPQYSPVWTLDLIYSNQANADVTHNNAVRKLEAISGHLIVKSKTTSAQPGGPSDGDAYILPAGSTGTNWAGNDGKLAVDIGGSWWFVSIKQGATAYCADTDTLYVLKAGGWVTVI